MYLLGVFYNKTDALKYLGYAQKIGFDKAYILNQYELDNESKVNLNPDAKKKQPQIKIDQRALHYTT